jgi:hypothetical protein
MCSLCLICGAAWPNNDSTLNLCLSLLIAPTLNLCFVPPQSTHPEPVSCPSSKNLDIQPNQLGMRALNPQSEIDHLNRKLYQMPLKVWCGGPCVGRACVMNDNLCSFVLSTFYLCAMICPTLTFSGQGHPQGDREDSISHFRTDALASRPAEVHAARWHRGEWCHDKRHRLCLPDL